MKRNALLRQLVAIAAEKGMTFALVRHGANHDVYDLGGTRVIVGRHADIPEPTARDTIRKARKL